MNNQERIRNWTVAVLDYASLHQDRNGLEMLQHCGSKCAENSELYKGVLELKENSPKEYDPDKLFKVFKERYYNRNDFTKEGNKIRLVFEKCTCPLVEQGVKTPFLCNCTTGFTKKIFETLFDKTVQIELISTILEGNSICEQQITIDADSM